MEKKILLVDDSLVARMSVKKILDGEGFVFKEASSGTIAVEILKNESFDCILMDYLMPGLTGLTTLKIIRKMGIDTPVIIISANQQDSVINNFIEMKVSAMLKKHVHKEELLAALHEALSKGQVN